MFFRQEAVVERHIRAQQLEVGINVQRLEVGAYCFPGRIKAATFARRGAVGFFPSFALVNSEAPPSQKRDVMEQGGQGNQTAQKTRRPPLTATDRF